MHDEGPSIKRARYPRRAIKSLSHLERDCFLLFENEDDLSRDKRAGKFSLVQSFSAANMDFLTVWESPEEGCSCGL